MKLNNKTRSVVWVVWCGALVWGCTPEVEQSVDLKGEVSLESQDSHADIRVHLSLDGALVDSTLTDAQGAFVFRGVSRVGYRLTFSHPGYTTQTEIIAALAGEGFVINEGSPVVLKPDLSASLRGRLVSRGQTFTNWNDLVRVARLHIGGGRALNLSVEPDGDFSVEGVPPGLWVLEVDVLGHLPRALPVELEGGEHSIGDLELVPESQDQGAAVQMAGRACLGSCAGRGVDHSGIVVQAFVGENPVGSVVTDNEGNFVLSTSGAPHTLTLSRPDYLTIRGIEVAWDEDGGRFEVEGEPLTEFEGFALQPDLSASLSGVLRTSVEGFGFGGTLVSLVGESGAASISVNDEGAFSVQSLAPGLYVLQVEVPGHRSVNVPVTLQSGTNGPMEVILGPLSVSMTGRVGLDGAEDVSGGVVRLSRGAQVVGLALSDLEGAFGFEALPVAHHLAFEKSGFVPREVEVQWDADEGRFEVAGAPLSEQFIELSREPFEGSIAVSLDVAPDWIPEAQRTATVRLIGEGIEESRGPIADGESDIFPGLSEGVYLIFVERPGFSPERRLVTLSEAENTASVSMTTTLEDLSAARLELVGVRVPADELEGVELRGANLIGVDFSGQDLAGVDLSEANLTGADLSGASLVGAVLQGARLTTADLRGADLACANADGAEFFGAIFDEAVLYDTSFVGATLQSARFRDADFSEFNLGFETEPNNIPQEAEVLEGIPAKIIGRVFRGGVDWYALDVAEAVSLRVSALRLRGGPADQIRYYACETTTGCSYDEGFLARSQGVFGESLALDLDPGTYYIAIENGPSFAFGTDYRLLVSEPTSRTHCGEVVSLAAPQNYRGADMTRTDLRGADLRGLDLRGVELNQASLREARASGVDLRSVSMNLVDLTDTVMRGARLQGAVMLNAFMLRTLAGEARFDNVSMQNSIIELADLNTAILFRTNLNGSNLTGTDLSFAAANEASMLGVIIGNSGETQTSFTGASLVGADLGGVLFNHALLEGTNFTDANLRSSVFTECELNTDTRFAGANLSSADLSTLSLNGIDFSGANLDNANLRLTFLSGSDFSGASLQGADLSSSFIFFGADFSEAQMILVDFSGARISNTDFTDAVMRGAQMDDISASDCSFVRADLTLADLERASLFVSMRDAILVDANLRGAVMRRENGALMDMRGANMSGADLSSADLSGGNFDGATWDDETICPDERPQSEYPRCGF